MRIAAQVAMALIPLAYLAVLKQPLLLFGGLQVIISICMWVIGWYVLFTLPRELVDRHAAQLAAPRDMSHAYTNTGPLGRL